MRVQVVDTNLDFSVFLWIKENVINSEALKDAVSYPTGEEGLTGRFGVAIVCRSFMFYKCLSYLKISYISCLGSDDNKWPMLFHFTIAYWDLLLQSIIAIMFPGFGSILHNGFILDYRISKLYRISKFPLLTWGKDQQTSYKSNVFLYRYSIKVALPHPVTVQVRTSKPDVFIKLQILENEEIVVSSTGKGHAIIPAINFLGSEKVVSSQCKCVSCLFKCVI